MDPKGYMKAGTAPTEATELPEEVLAVIPSDLFQQLELVRCILSRAISTRATSLEAETGSLKQDLAGKEKCIKELEEKVAGLEASLKESNERLSVLSDEQSRVAAERDALVGEKSALVSTVRKLNRDVAKLESFKRALMQSLQEDDDQEETPDGQGGSGSSRLAKAQDLGPPSTPASSSRFVEEDDSPKSRPAVSRSSSLAMGDREGASTPHKRENGLGLDDARSQTTGLLHKPVEAAVPAASSTVPTTPGPMPPSPGSSSRPRSINIPLRTPSLTPHLTPSHTPTGSPRRRSADDRALFSVPSASQPSSAANSPPSAASGAGATPGSSTPARGPRVDGKEFFRQARNRLSYEQFSQFLANIKELNAHRQTREETLRKADEIFGPDNKDLYQAFDSLLSRHLPS